MFLTTATLVKDSDAEQTASVEMVAFTSTATSDDMSGGEASESNGHNAHTGSVGGPALPPNSRESDGDRSLLANLPIFISVRNKEDFKLTSLIIMLSLLTLLKTAALQYLDMS